MPQSSCDCTLLSKLVKIKGLNIKKVGVNVLMSNVNKNYDRT